MGLYLDKSWVSPCQYRPTRKQPHITKKRCLVMVTKCFHSFTVYILPFIGIKRTVEDAGPYAMRWRLPRPCGARNDIVFSGRRGRRPLHNFGEIATAASGLAMTINFALCVLHFALATARHPSSVKNQRFLTPSPRGKAFFAPTLCRRGECGVCVLSWHNRGLYRGSAGLPIRRWLHTRH